MKIERISDNQIRCTLTNEDLSVRNIRLSELAYGSPKTRKLFRELMEEAATETGFDTQGMPLMVEAIPTSADSLMLIVTRVDDPEELDARFSRFSRQQSDPESEPQQAGGTGNGQAQGDSDSDELERLFRKLFETIGHMNGSEEEVKNSDTGSGAQAQRMLSGAAAAGSRNGQPAEGTGSPAGDRRRDAHRIISARAFQFETLDDVIDAAHTAAGSYRGRNALYRMKNRSGYELTVHIGSSPKSFARVCTLLSEYGRPVSCPAARESYLAEHGDVLIRSGALKKLSAVR